LMGELRLLCSAMGMSGRTLITRPGLAPVVMELRPPWAIRRSWLVKAEDETDPRYGWRPDERPLSEYLRLGVVNLDKPPGPTSHETTSWVKRVLGVGKAGHGGTLGTARGARAGGEIPV